MKKIALVLALLMLALCCVGCGNDEKANETTGGTAASQSDTQLENPDIELCAESEDGKHEYNEELINEATCVENGLMLYTCVACSQSITKEIPATGHEGTGASCEEPSICTVCWEIVEEAWGHDGEYGICRNCGIDMVQIPTVPQTSEPVETEAEEVETTEATAAR